MIVGQNKGRVVEANRGLKDVRQPDLDGVDRAPVNHDLMRNALFGV